ncbi:DUF3597 domain-containing protein [Alteraurantiacibacter aquimixticola]|uniref:DUF3597 domain-containing protein n=1 Tax=Alteraurantiacibacter aquimixticola TaxID=2489173 RepID=A0A4T3F1J2_9SPHN|nr:DUF3597 domain-containing protein [Alteraurantiacibacter aquimixticola]TIX50145.1 DUF3597 domain-containing protein [Alteraurantiacibacter aquimixticola]
MGIFSSIKDAIFGKAEAQEAPVPTPAPTSTPFGKGKPEQLDEVDIEASLDARDGADKLNWRTSIVDLMKLVGLDASYAERKELAQELGREDYSGTAEDNIWLHRQVMNKLAENGGRVPPSLRD